MASQPIPANLQPLPAPVNLQALNINQLLSIIAEYMQVSIDVDNVSFFGQGATYPVSNQGLFFNTSDAVWAYWNDAQGRYVPLTDWVVGDQKSSFLSGDEISDGWVNLDGRTVALAISAGLSSFQTTNLQTLFGVSGTLPVIQNVTPNGTAYGKVFVGFP